jgi:hypothetical protein
MRGDPLTGLGGGGMGASPCQTLLMPPFHANVYSMQGNSAEQMQGDCMYTVTVQWGDLVKTHKAWTLSSAKEWMYTYPNKDVFAKVTNVFGSTVAVRYKR